MNQYKQRGRISNFPVKLKDGTISPPSEGMNPSELWGVSQRDRGVPRKKRSKAALERRLARRSAKRAGVPFKKFLRATARGSK